MSDKERLEEIKNKKFFDVGNGDLLNLEDVNWLIEQAEKREYWMKQHRKRANELEDAYFKIQLIENQLHQAQAKAERYKQALEFYADKENYRGYLTAGGWVKTPVNDDDGEKARKALEGEE